MKRHWMLVVGLAFGGCGGAESTPGPTGPTAGPPPLEVAVEIGSIALADDCAAATPAATQAATQDRATNQEPAAAAQRVAPGFAAERMACQQTTMQLAVRGGATGAPTQLAITRVELLDDAGQSLGELAPRAPKLWADGGYVAWDAVVAPGQHLTVSYDLAAPDWSKLGGSRHAAQGRTFVVRVTVRTGDGDQARTVEKKVVSPVLVPEPPIVT